jgi:alkylation response protein AidB-like acyl-CoA dehydrogenase
VVSTPLDSEHGIGREDPNHLAEINGLGAGYTTILGRVLAEAVEWASGARRAQDPIVRRRIAQVALDMEVSRNTPGAMGRMDVEWLQRDAADLIDMIGPDALLNRETEGAVGEGVIEWAHRHSQGGAIFGGTTEIHRNIIAQRILGLPRPPLPRTAA